MKKIKHLIFILATAVLASCNSSKINAESQNEIKTEEQIGLLTDYIVNDTIFISHLKNYYPDLKIVSNLIFEPLTKIEFIPLNKFTQETLTQTEFYKEYKDLDYLEFKSLINKTDSLNKFSSYKLKYEIAKNGKLGSGDKKILLKFSRRINNLLNIEYTIIDNNVDPRIVYTPRKGYYLIEFNKNNEIVERYYLLRTSG